MVSFRSHVPFLLFLTAIFFINFLTRVILSPLLPTIERDLNIGHSEAGSLFFFISLGFLMGLLSSGFVSSHLTYRRTIILSSVAVGGSLLAVSLSYNLLWIRLGLIVQGLSAGLYLPSGIATLTDTVSSEHWGKGIATHELAPILAYIASPLLAEGLLIWFSWRQITGLVAGTAIVLGAAFWRFGRGGDFPGQTPNPETLRVLLTRPSFWIMTGLFGMGISGSLGVYSMLPLYLVSARGLERGLANTLVGVSRIAGLGVIFIAGWATDRLGPKRTMGGAFLATGLATILLGIAPGKWFFPPLFLQPVLAGCFFPAGLAAVSKIGPPQVRNVAVSLIIPVAYLLGGGAIPAGTGVMGEHGLFSLGIVLVGMLIMAGALLAQYLKFYQDAGEGTEVKVGG